MGSPVMTASFFCPRCWQETDELITICPSCSYDRAGDSDLPYEEKLLGALRHPVRENRMIAVQMLGDLRSRAAIPVFASFLETETDFYFLREIIHALGKMGNPDSMRLLRLLKKHKSALIRKAAAEQLLACLREVPIRATDKDE